MRIRNTKPEFWRSKRVATELDFETRFILKALESYVDDNGVGKDELALIVSDTFPHDMALEPSRTFKRVKVAIDALFLTGFIHRYEASGDNLLFISWWESTQYINRPSRGRLPRPDGTWDYGDSEIGAPNLSPQEPSRDLSAESGNQGIRESVHTRTESAPEKPKPATDDQRFDEWWEHYPKKVDKGKARAPFKAALKKTSLETLIAAAQRYAEATKSSERRFIKAPSTWLNAEAWDNPEEPSPQRPQSSFDPWASDWSEDDYRKE